MNTSPTEAIQCSQRLGSITIAQFQAALDVFSLGTFVSAEPVRNGTFGQNVYLTSSTGAYVLRGCPHADWQFPTERFFCRQVHERTHVPAPWPYLYEPSVTIFGWPFAIMRRMPGTCAGDAFKSSLTSIERIRFQRTMGATLAGFAEATLPHFGTYDVTTNAIKPVTGGLRAERMAWISSLLADSERYCLETILPDRGWIDDVVGAACDRSLQDFQPTIATSDFNSGNTVIERTVDGWRCTGVFDFMEYSSGDLEASMTRPLIDCGGHDPDVPRAFIDGYIACRQLREHARERFALYVLGDRLIIWNFGHSAANWFAPELSFRTYVEPIIATMMHIIGPYAR